MPIVLHLAAATDILEHLVAREKLRILLFADLEALLCLHQRVCVEHPLDLGRRHVGLIEAGPRRRHLLAKELFANKESPSRGSGVFRFAGQS